MGDWLAEFGALFAQEEPSAPSSTPRYSSGGGYSGGSSFGGSSLPEVKLDLGVRSDRLPLFPITPDQSVDYLASFRRTPDLSLRLEPEPVVPLFNRTPLNFYEQPTPPVQVSIGPTYEEEYGRWVAADVDWQRRGRTGMPAGAPPTPPSLIKWKW